MKFKLRIPGRDDIQDAPAAKVANPRILIESSVNLPTIAANDASDTDPIVEPIRRFADSQDSQPLRSSGL